MAPLMGRKNRVQLRLLGDHRATSIAQNGPISLHFASQKLLPAKTRAFVDFVTQAFREQQLAHRLSVKRQGSMNFGRSPGTC